MDHAKFDDPLMFQKMSERFAEHGYALISKIGQGGFSVVYLAESRKYNQRFVIKVSNNKKSDETEAEIKTLIKLDHPNIISIFEYFTDDEYIYLVLEHCSGGSMETYIKQNGRLPKPLLYQVCAHLLSALYLCHSLHIAHRDIKPANILIDQYGRPKLADFGLSSEFVDGESTRGVGGSRLYMAPEIIQKKPYDAFKADVWALGVSFYQMAVGTTPWPASNLNETEFAISMGMISFTNAHMDFEFVKVIKAMIEVNPAKRETVASLRDKKIFTESMNSHISLISIEPVPSSSMIFGRKNPQPMPRNRRSSLVEIRKTSSSFNTMSRRLSMHRTIMCMPTFSAV